MARAAVLIGVNRTGKLPVLNDAVEGAKRMEQWALSQGMARQRVLLFTDEGGPVDVSDIRKAIRKLVDSGAISQLIVYFAGHGVNIRYGEYWLLSDAPEDASAAVNVEGSIVLARRCGIPHVVLISDACRTAAEGVQAQGMSGSEIFPNDPVPGPERPIDIFFGTTLGRPALEVKDPAQSTAAFKAIYTGALLDAVSGKLPAVLTPATIDGRQTRVVRPRPLKACLLAELPQRLAGLHLPPDVSQVPDARITSDDDAWLATLDQTVAAPPATQGEIPGAPVTRSATPVTRSEAAVTVEARLQAQLRDMLAPAAGIARSARRGGAGAPIRERAAAPIRERAAAPPPSEAQVSAGSACVFKVSGSQIAECLAATGDAAAISAESSSARVDTPQAAVNVLLRLSDGSGVLLPALRGHDALVMVDDDEVVDVSYDPSPGTGRAKWFADDAPRLRKLRALAAAAARDNAFRPDKPMAEALADRMMFDRHFDPSLAIYAAYAFHELGMPDRVRQLSLDVHSDIGVSFFDLALLSRTLPEGSTGEPAATLPPMPMLARGWTLLSAYGISVPRVLRGIERQLRPSLWTHFDRTGTDRISDLIKTKGLQ